MSGCFFLKHGVVTETNCKCIYNDVVLRYFFPHL